jgi:hypothetical protein
MGDRFHAVNKPRLLDLDEPIMNGDEVRHALSEKWLPTPPQMVGVTLRQAASAEWFTGDARRVVHT